MARGSLRTGISKFLSRPVLALAALLSLAPLFQNCSEMHTADSESSEAASASVQEIAALSSSSYSHLGVLSGSACRTSNGRLLHLELSVNPAEIYYATLDGVKVSSCAAYDFPAVNAGSLTLTYRSVSQPISACSDGCTGTYCGTGGAPVVFLSVNPSEVATDTWRRLDRFSATNFARQSEWNRVTLTLNGAGTVRSVLICRDASGHERDDVEVQSVSLVPSSIATVQPVTGRKSPLRMSLETQWQTRHADIRGRTNQVWEGVPYPAAEVYDLLSGWMVTQNEDWKADIERQLAYARTRLTPDGFPYEAEKYAFLTRDAMAREAMAYYDAGIVLRNPQYVRWADEIAVRMMTTLVRTSFSWKGQTYKLFHVTYDKQAPHAPLDAATSIDPNQNAELGVLYTLLYFDPSSVLYKNPLAKEIAMNELSASMALQTETGELALYSMALDQYDTNYGSYAVSLWVRANTYWKSDDYAHHIALAGNWFSKMMERGHEGEHFYPTYSTVVYTWEMWWRIPSLLAAGIPTDEYIKMLTASWVSPGFPFFFHMVGISNDAYLSFLK